MSIIRGEQGHIEYWAEKLRCPSCSLTGVVRLSQGESDDAPTVLSLPAGFKDEPREFGPSFYCKTCDVLVDP